MDTNLLFNNALAVINSAGYNRDVFSRWSLELILPNGVIVKTLDVLGIHLIRDFVRNYTDELSVETILPLGDWVYDIYPNRANLYATLYRIPIHPKTSKDLPDAPIASQTFKVVLNKPVDYTIEIGDSLPPNKTAMNKDRQHRFRLQLMDEVVFDCSGWEYSGTVFNQDKDDLLVSAMSLSPLVKGVSVLPPTASRNIKNLVIPAGISLTEFPGWLQAKGGGVYNAGIGWYMQRGYWWLYPLYDTSRFSKPDSNTLTIINLPQTKMPQVETTYTVVEGEIFILTTSEIRFNDQTDSRQLSGGTGVRFAKQNLLASDPLEETVKLNRRRDLSEVSYQGREDKNYAKFSSDLQKENTAVELSKLAEQRGIFAQLVWTNSTLNILDPGMPVRLLYDDGGVIVKLEGTLLGVEHHSVNSESGAMNRKHQTSSYLSVFLNRDSFGGANG